jgi:threonine synthase
MSLWRFADLLPAPAAEFRLSLGEGNTPLVKSQRLGPSAGLPNLYYKLETANPTNSYKDRFAAVAVSLMRAAGKRRCVAMSSGNAGSALAAYCTAAGIRCEIAIVEGAPQGKLQQMLAYGADLIRIQGFGLDPAITARCIQLLRELGNTPDAAMKITAYAYSPLGMTGVQTIAYEIAEQAEPLPQHVFCQAGGGGLTLAVARGFAQLVSLGKISQSPSIQCVQPAGNNTMAGPLREGLDRGREVQCTSTVSGLQVPTIIDAHEVIHACRDTGGTGHLVTDEQVWAVQRRLAREDGIFCEPSAAVSVAGALQAREQGLIDGDAPVVCLITGSGFKDPASIERLNSDVSCPLITVDDLAARVSKKN